MLYYILYNIDNQEVLLQAQIANINSQIDARTKAINKLSYPSQPDIDSESRTTDIPRLVLLL